MNSELASFQTMSRCTLGAGHRFLIENDAGIAAGYTNEEYQQAGAEIFEDASSIWNQSEMIIKVKEPLPSEFDYLRKGLIIFTFFHLAANRRLTEVLLEKEVTAVAYETITDEEGRLPILKPMSEIAGRLSIQEGAKYLEKQYGGSGVLLSGVSGVTRGKVLVLGCGVVGQNANQNGHRLWGSSGRHGQERISLRSHGFNVS